jgi:enediyne biosynthesis protein E4
MCAAGNRVRFALIACAGASLATAFSAEARAAFTEQGSTILSASDVVETGRSASLGDVDNDGDLDLFFQGNPRVFYLNNKIGPAPSFTFMNATSLYLNGTGLGPSWSAAWGDYDGDRRVDLFVGQSNGSGTTGDVLRNTGTTFSNQSTATGLNDPGFHQNVAWADIDNDRDLDLLLGMEGPEKHEIYLQGPSGTFTPVGAAVGFQTGQGTRAYGMAIGDTDGDGDLDVYISTCQPGGNVRNNFYKNMLVENGTLGFVDIADTNGTQDTRNTYGTEFADFDDDGDLDLYMTGADGNPSRMWRNDGGNMFTDMFPSPGPPLLSDAGGDFNGSRAVDYDNDGDLDLFFHDHLAAGGKNYGRLLYRNDGNWQFTNVTTAEGLNSSNMGGFDSAWGDLDLDGDQDLVVPTENGFRERVYVNNASTNGNRWLYVRLEGPTDNTTGIGAALYATINQGTPQERTLRREANTNAGTFNQSDLPVHFGLGAATVIDELRIEWRDGTVQTLYDVATNQYLTVWTPGDFDGDGEVDGADYAEWRGDFGLDGGSDSDGDGDSDGADFLFWQRQLGNGERAVAVNTAVPEPGAGWLAALGATRMFARRRRRSH